MPKSRPLIDCPPDCAPAGGSGGGIAAPPATPAKSGDPGLLAALAEMSTEPLAALVPCPCGLTVAAGNKAARQQLGARIGLPLRQMPVLAPQADRIAAFFSGPRLHKEIVLPGAAGTLRLRKEGEVLLVSLLPPPASMAQEAATHLIDGLERLKDGLILYDAEDRVMLFNQRFLDFFPELAPFVRPGITFEAVMRNLMASGTLPIPPEQAEAWLTDRLHRHRNPGPPFETALGKDRIIRVAEHRTGAGGHVSLVVDVTALRTSERRLRDLIDGSLQGIVIHRGFDVLYANQSFAGIFGFDTAEALLKEGSLDFIIPPENKGLARRSLDRLLREGGSFQRSRVAALRHDGTRIWIEVAVRAVDWLDGPALQSIVMDVTERARAEDALAASEARFRDLVSTVPGLVYQWYERTGGVHGYSYVSPRSREMYGIAPEDLVRDWSLLPIHPEDQDRWRRTIADAVLRETDWSFEGRFILPDGSVRWWRAVSRPVRVGPDEVRFNGIVIDIEEQKRAEAELQSREAMLRYSASLAGLGYWVWDRRLAWTTYCSPELAAIRGVTVEEYLETLGSFEQQLRWIQPEDRDYYRTHALDVARSRRTYVVEYRILRPDGQTRYVREVGGPVYDDRGELVKYVGALQDITDRKQRELELEEARDRLERQAAEMTALALELQTARDAAEAASRAKSRFLAVMSHELRTPMTGVIGMIDLLLGTTVTSDQRRYLETLHSSADALLVVLNDILDFSKIEAGQLVIEAIPVRLQALLDDVIDLFAPAASQKGVELRVRQPDRRQKNRLPTELTGDPTRLRQVLMNLVGNAVKFTPAGSIELRAEARREESGSWLLRFEVEDTGIGIPPDVVPMLFESFTQADASTTRRFGGTGLGLAICKRLVTMMGGEIGVRSEPRRGSVFWFTVRMAGPAAEPAEETVEVAAEEGRASGARVLLAEDNPVNRLLITTMLERMGFRPDAVANGREAVEAVQRERYDVVLMDMQMPEMDGDTAAGVIRDLPEPLCRLPIVALTADALPENRARHLRARLFDEYLTKPIDWPRLGEVIAALAARG